MSLPFACPPVVDACGHKEQSLYMRASAQRRVNILCNYAKEGARLGDRDLVALAVEEVKNVYGGKLPPGKYGNSQGLFFEVDDWEKLSKIRWRLPQQDFAWYAGQPRRPPPQQLPHEYQFAAGTLRWQNSSLPFCGAAFRGYVPPLHQQQQQLAPAAYGGHFLNSVPPPQQYFFAAICAQQAPAALAPAFAPFAADEQHHDNIAPALEEPTSFSVAADELPLSSLAAPVQQSDPSPAASLQEAAVPVVVETDEEFYERLYSVLQEDIARMHWEQEKQVAMQESHSDTALCPYPGHAPAMCI